MTYADKIRAKHTKAIVSLSGDCEHKKGVTKIYVDGSYNTQTQRAGWGWVAIDYKERIVASAYGNENDKSYGSRNITGECKAVVEALMWVKQYGQDGKIVIVHDYIGLGKWAAGEWKTNTQIAKDYVEAVKQIGVSAEFRHIKGHAGNRWNEEADVLAERGKTSSDRTFGKFIPHAEIKKYKKEVWKTITG